MIKRIICIFLCLFFVFALSGCDLLTTETAELLSPPSLSEELSLIAEAIDNSVSADYEFEYPSRGDYRSAVVQTDINDDGVFEAFAFYGITEGENVTMNINALVCKDGVWSSAAQQKIVAGGVDKIEFCDLDADGSKEILVGWEIYGTTEMQLGVYSVGENTLTQRMLQQYSQFVTCDLDGDKINEILVIKANAAEQLNTANLFEFNDEGVTEIASCELDSAAKTINEPIIATLSTGKAAAYIDEIKGVGAVTEVVFIEKGVMVNPLFAPDTRETVATLRSSVLRCMDIDGDSILDIPVQVAVPSVTKTKANEKLYLIDWCSFNGESLTKQITSMVNAEDGYYYEIPEKWVGKIAVLKDTENRLRQIYWHNAEENSIGDSLIYIKAVPKADWDSGKYKTQGIFEIMNDGQESFICSISDTAKKEGITAEEIKLKFKLYE